MEESTFESTQPSTTRDPLPPALASFHLSFRPMYTALTLIIGIVCGVGGLFAYQEYTRAPQVSSYEECIKIKGSVVQESYPSTCVTKDGKQFIQPLIDEEKKKLISLPSSIFVYNIADIEPYGGKNNQNAITAIRTVLNEPPACWVTTPMVNTPILTGNAATLT